LPHLKKNGSCISRTQQATNNFRISIALGGMALLTKLEAGPGMGRRGWVMSGRVERGETRDSFMLVVHCGVSVSSAEFYRHSSYSS